MGVFFAKKKHPSRITDQDKAVLQLKQTRDKLKQYQKRIEQCIEKDREIAKRLLKNNQKDRALLLLRKKKFQEQLLINADGQLENLEKMVHDIEFAQVEIKTLDGIKLGNEAIQKLYAILSIDEIEKVMDETKEAIEKQQEINDILSGTLTDEEEENVETELNALILADTDVIIQDLSDNLVLPELPTEQPSKEKEFHTKPKQLVTLKT